MSQIESNLKLLFLKHNLKFMLVIESWIFKNLLVKIDDLITCKSSAIIFCFLSPDLKARCGLGVMETMENWEEEAVMVAKLPS